MNIILVDSNSAIRGKLARALAEQGHDVTEAATDIDLYRLTATTPCDVAVVDIDTPHREGISVVHYLSTQSPASVIAMASRDAARDRIRAYQSGADICLIKPVVAEELVAATFRLGTRRQHVSRTETEAGRAWILDPDACRLWAPDGKILQLTRQESRFLELFARTQSAIHSRDDIQKWIDTDQTGGGRGRFDTLISRLRAKARQKLAGDLPIVTAHMAGVSFSEPLTLIAD